MLTALAWQHSAWPHDIPNQRVDRSTQVTVRPGRIEIDYEVSLTELTLTQDLRALIGSLPGAERSEWLARYGQVTSPLNARGFLVSCNGQSVSLSVRDYDLVVEEHPRYTFHFTGTLPKKNGRLLIHDTNYVSSEGTSRLAVRACDGVELDGNTLPEDVDQIPIQPVWQLGDEEERRTRRAEIGFRTTPLGTASIGPTGTRVSTSEIVTDGGVATSLGQGRRTVPLSAGAGWTNRLSRLLGRNGNVSWLGLVIFAAGLGAIHSIQPGHGKTLVSAIALQPDALWYQPALLGLCATCAHTASVLGIAAILFWTRASQVAGLHQGLMQVAGFAIGAVGFWGIGRHLGGWKESHGGGKVPAVAMSSVSIVSLGTAAGMVPCWDAVSLVVLSAALDRLALGVTLVIAFGAGMAAVLVVLGLAASRFKSALVSSGAGRWQSRLGLLGNLVLAGIGSSLFLR
jgi:ABC-type nickel/cobalt efflux system permease component RcnA